MQRKRGVPGREQKCLSTEASLDEQTDPNCFAQKDQMRHKDSATNGIVGKR